MVAATVTNFKRFVKSGSRLEIDNGITEPEIHTVQSVGPSGAWLTDSSEFRSFLPWPRKKDLVSRADGSWVVHLNEATVTIRPIRE